MADTLDLVCNEVIMEDQIEPQIDKVPNSSSKYATTAKRPTSRYLQGVKEEEEDAQACVPRKRRHVGILKRRKLCWGAESHVSLSGGVAVVAEDEVREHFEDPMHSILPTEICWGILKQLTESELLPLRVTSRKWRSTIDSMIKVNVKIDGDSKEFQGQCGLPMKSCRLISLQNPSHRHLFKSPVPEEVKISRGICSVNFEELALQWTSLNKLELCWRSTMKNMLFEKKGLEGSLSAKTILPNLNSLRIELLINDNLGKRTQLRILSNVNNLTRYDFPRLTDFSITFVGYRELHSENRYLSTLLPFINRHASSLCCLDFTLKYASHVKYPPAHPRHILFCVPANIKSNYKAPQSSLEGHLVTTQLRKLDATPQHQLEWLNMLKNTRKLEVAIMTRFVSWSIKHLEFFLPTIREYSKFLRRVDIMNVTMYDSGAHNTVTQLDAIIFRDCLQLVHLRLYRAPIIFHEDEIEPPTELINLHQLPKTLEDLVVDGLPVASLEILATISEFPNLRTFHYFQSQVPRRNMLWTNGINWEILQKIILHPKLSNVKVHVTTAGQSHLQYEESFKHLAKEHGWNTSGIVPGYMNMFQITLTKADGKIIS